MSAKGVAHVFDPWDEGFAKLQAKLGPPTKIDGKKHYWAAMRGDDCAYMYVEKQDGKEFHKEGLMVGTIQNPEIYDKDAAIMNRADRLDLVGKGTPLKIRTHRRRRLMAARCRSKRLSIVRSRAARSGKASRSR